MNEFEHLSVEGVGIGRAQRGGTWGGQWGGCGGCCPGIACNKFYSSFKGGGSVFKTCTSFIKPSGLWLNIHLASVMGNDSMFLILTNIWSLNCSQINDHSLFVTWHCKAILTKFSNVEKQSYNSTHCGCLSLAIVYLYYYYYFFTFFVYFICLYQSVGMCIWWNSYVDIFFKVTKM